MANGIASGEAFVCGISNRLVGITYKFREGSIVYSCEKAARGNLERVAIKTVSISYRYGKPVISYKDTFNTFWMEDELCSESEAVAAAINYLEVEQARLIAALENCEM